MVGLCYLTMSSIRRFINLAAGRRWRSKIENPIRPCRSALQVVAQVVFQQLRRAEPIGAAKKSTSDIWLVNRLMHYAREVDQWSFREKFKGFSVPLRNIQLGSV